MGFVPNVSEAIPDSPPHVSVRPSCRYAPFRPTFQASEHCRTIRYERRSWSDRMMACHSARNSARKIRRCAGRVCATAHPACPPWDPCLHIKEPSTNSLPQNCCQQHLGVSTRESYHRACVQECTSQQGRASGLSPTRSCRQSQSVPDADESEEGPCGFLGRLDMPRIDAAPSLAQLVHNTDKSGVQQFPPCSLPLASTIPIVSHPEPP